MFMGMFIDMFIDVELRVLSNVYLLTLVIMPNLGYFHSRQARLLLTKTLA